MGKMFFLSTGAACGTAGLIFMADMRGVGHSMLI